MDKSWITKPRNTHEFQEGVQGFLEFAFAHRSVEGKIKCPCPDCVFRNWETRAVVYDHLICRGFPTTYTIWFWHGESTTGETSNSTPSIQNPLYSHDPIHNMINDAFGISRDHVNVEACTSHQPVHEGEERMPELNQGPNEETKAFYDLVRDGNQELYEGCTKYSKLSFLVKLYHIKCLCGLSNKAMSMILELLKDAFEHAEIPDSFYEAKKLITKLGLNYSQIHACPNDCMLYCGEDESRETCKVCNTSRWKQSRKGNPTNMSGGGKKRKNKPVKVLRYFPLKPCLQRLFMSSKTAEHMRWHSVDGNKDGLMRHPRDSEAWKRFDETHLEFASDPRNVRLGLASDGFNPFGTLSTNYSIWPMILIPYNLPP
ncbi:uncharacterized protein LOC127794134 [Diospyros lotus]|uniref:uncharacterized protein LOC127794134 n=1 Tax=Diospyros lotus TaxID=55363 RepID=UPI00224CB06D|nr:uncharacterized protein LOC127794134 [Diospyros lotus]